MLEAEVESSPEIDEGRLWLYFTEGASVLTVEELEAAAKTWKDILHHFSRMPGADAGFGRILAIQKHSPLELELAANVAVLLPLAMGINWVLSRVEQVIRIQTKAEELRQLKVKGETIDLLLEEAQEKREEIAAEAADQLKDHFKADGDARNAAEVGLREVLRFIESGGELDIDVPNPPTEEGEADDAENGAEPAYDLEALGKLRETILSIREELKLLPPPPAGDNEEE